MLKWHAHALKGNQFDTWLRGRFLEEWADPRVVEQMKDAFAHYEAGGIAHALRLTMDIYRWLEDETATKWGYATPREGERHAADATLKLIATMDIGNTPGS